VYVVEQSVVCVAVKWGGWSGGVRKRVGVDYIPSSAPHVIVHKRLRQCWRQSEMPSSLSTRIIRLRNLEIVACNDD